MESEEKLKAEKAWVEDKFQEIGREYNVEVTNFKWEKGEGGIGWDKIWLFYHVSAYWDKISFRKIELEEAGTDETLDLENTIKNRITSLLSHHLVSEDELLAILNKELSRYDQCEGCNFNFPPVKLIHPDEAGCNWTTVGLYEACGGGLFGGLSEICRPFAFSIVFDAKEKYNIKRF